MNEDKTTTGDVKAALEYAAKAAAPIHMPLAAPECMSDTAIILRDAEGNQTIELASAHLRELPTAPERRKGTVTVHDLASFVGATNRDKRPDTIIFADVPQKRLVSVLDFHGPADSSPRFGEDRIEYGFKLSQQLTAWLFAAREPMDQKAFARLIDDRIMDLGEHSDAGGVAADFAARLGLKFPTIADMLVFTRTIQAKSAVESTEMVDEETGDVRIQYMKKNDVKTADGQPVPVPRAFLLKIPVLNGIGTTVFTIAVRLRFDIEEKAGIRWRIEVHALDKYVQAAVEEAVATVRKPAPDGCGLPVWLASIP